MNQHLTDVICRRLPLPAKGNKVHYDATVPGFGVCVTAKGARSFVLNYRTKSGRERRYTLGACMDWSTTDARREAHRLRRLVSEGGDPLADVEAEREAPTMAQLCDRFIAEHLPKKRPSTREAYIDIITKYVRPHFGAHMKVADVAFADVDELHRKITASGSPYSANRTVALVHKMLELARLWAMRSGDNPAKGIERNTEIKRKRYLKDDELSRLCKALAAHRDRQAADIIRLMLLTGCRRGEALAMRWADVDLTEDKSVWSKPASSTKQKEDHTPPLSAPACMLLSKIKEQQTAGHRVLGQWVFPAESDSGHRASIKRTWDQILRATGIENLRLHDLRHSFASEVVSHGGSLPLIGALLGHANVSSTHRYSHLYDTAQRAAVEKVGAKVGAAFMAAANGTTRPPGEVITLNEKRPRRGR